MPRSPIHALAPDELGPEERAAERLLEAIGLGNWRRIGEALDDNARRFPEGSWRARAVIAALYWTSDAILAQVLAAGGDPDARCDDGCALEIAGQLGDGGKVRLLIDAGAVPPRRQPAPDRRREVAVSYRASAQPQKLLVEMEAVTSDDETLARELPLRMSAALAPLVAVADAGGLGADRFDPAQAIAHVVNATSGAPAIAGGRHFLRWQLRVGGLAPSGLAVILSALLAPLPGARVLKLSARGVAAPDDTGDAMFLAGRGAAERLAARAGQLGTWPHPPFAVEEVAAIRPRVDIDFGAPPSPATRAALAALLRGWTLALSVLAPGAGEQLSRFASLGQGGETAGPTMRWSVEDRSPPEAGEVPFPRASARAMAVGILAGAAARGADVRRVRLALPGGREQRAEIPV